jgi:predicted nucleic acid-binding protein
VIFDSNIVLAMMDEDLGSPILDLLELRRTDRQVFINEIIFAELSPRFIDAALVAEVCETFGLEIQRLTLIECHRAGQAFAEYRRRGGERRSILADFLIGAQAEMRGWPLVTRDRKGFSSYFPQLEIIDPFEGVS